MKKIIILAIMLLLISGCGVKNEKVYKKAESNIVNKLKDTENVTEKEIEKAIKYIENNYEKIKKDDNNYQEFLEYAIYLEKVGNNADSEIADLGKTAKEYMNNFKSKNKKEIGTLLEKINKNREEKVKDFYNTYHKNVTIKKELEKAHKKIEKEAKEVNFASEEKINKALEYIIDNYENPLKNSEVSEKFAYYLEYIDEVGERINSQDQKVVEIVRKIKKNILNSKTDEEIKQGIEEISKQKDEYIKNLVSLIKK